MVETRDRPQSDGHVETDLETDGSPENSYLVLFLVILVMYDLRCKNTPNSTAVPNLVLVWVGNGPPFVVLADALPSYTQSYTHPLYLVYFFPRSFRAVVASRRLGGENLRYS